MALQHGIAIAVVASPMPEGEGGRVCGSLLGQFYFVYQKQPICQFSNVTYQ